MSQVGSIRPSGGLQPAPAPAQAAVSGGARGDTKASIAPLDLAVIPRPASEAAPEGRLISERNPRAAVTDPAPAAASPSNQAARRGLMTSDALCASAGIPKAARQFLGWTGSPRSTAYREILKTLDAYHTAADGAWLSTSFAATGNSKKDLQTAIQAARAQADKLSNLATAYGRGLTHSRKDAIAKLKSAVEAEIAVLESAAKSLASSGPRPDCDACTVLQLVKKGHTIESIHEAGIRSGRGGQGLSDNEVQLADKRFELVEEYKAAGLIGQMKLLEESGLGLMGGKLYKSFGVPITEETVKVRVTPERFKSWGNRIGSGKFNTTAEVRFEVPGGEEQSAVFKPVPIEEHGWGELTGIDARAPRTASRNLATQALGKALGFDVIAPTELGVVRDMKGHQVLGFVMERAGGRTGHKTPESDFLRGDVRAELIKLQIVDLLCGQIDRHGGNYFIELPEGGGQARVRGIDNDQGFGNKLNGLPGQPQFEVPGEEYSLWCFTPPGPPVIDSEMETAVNRLSEQDLEKTLGGAGLTDAEIGAAKGRLRELKAHVGTLRAGSRIIAPGEWGSPKATRFLVGNADDSYVMRHGHPKAAQAGAVGKEAIEKEARAARFVKAAGIAARDAGRGTAAQALALKAEEAVRQAAQATRNVVDASDRWAQAEMALAVERGQAGGRATGTTAGVLEAKAAEDALIAAIERSESAAEAANDALKEAGITLPD